MIGSLFRPFLRYALTGGLNTAVHWAVFAVLVGNGLRQSIANLLAFSVAVTVSYFVNAHWTFKAKTSVRRYLVMVGTMGCLSFAVGAVADRLALHPLVTLVGFSLVSLVIGFVIAKLVVFREVS